MGDIEGFWGGNLSLPGLDKALCTNNTKEPQNFRGPISTGEIQEENFASAPPPHVPESKSIGINQLLEL